MHQAYTGAALFPLKRNFIAKPFSMNRYDGTSTQHRMNLKANLVLLAGLMAFAASPAAAQVSETLPSTPRADKTGSSVPSMSNPGDARGSAPTQAVQSAKSIPAPRSDVKQTDSASTPPAPAAGSEDRARAAATSGVATEDMNTTELGDQIRTATFSDREKLFEALARRLAAIDADVDEVRRTAPSLTGEARKTFNLANKEFRAKKRQFDHVFGIARRAKPGEWEQVRNVLAREYETYSVAVTRIEGAGAFGL